MHRIFAITIIDDVIRPSRSYAVRFTDCTAATTNRFPYPNYLEINHECCRENAVLMDTVQIPLLHKKEEAEPQTFYIREDYPEHEFSDAFSHSYRFGEYESFPERFEVFGLGHGLGVNIPNSALDTVLHEHFKIYNPTFRADACEAYYQYRDTSHFSDRLVCEELGIDDRAENDRYISDLISRPLFFYAVKNLGNGNIVVPLKAEDYDSAVSEGDMQPGDLLIRTWASPDSLQNEYGFWDADEDELKAGPRETIWTF